MIFFININSSQAEFPASSDYLSLSRYLIFFRFTLQTFVRHLSHLPKVSIWSKKGLDSPVPPVEASGNALQTSRLCPIEDLTFCILFKYFSYVKSAMVNKYALLSRNEICCEYALFWIFLTQIWLRQMRFDSDFTQISGQKKADWGLWLELLDLLIKCPSLSPPLFVCFSILIPLALWSSQFWGDQRAGPALWSPPKSFGPPSMVAAVVYL